MTPEQAAAFVIAQAACAQVRCFAMQTQNFMDARTNKPLTWQPKDFDDLLNRFYINHNAVLHIFQDSK